MKISEKHFGMQPEERDHQPYPQDKGRYVKQQNDNHTSPCSTLGHRETDGQPVQGELKKVEG